MPKIAEILFDCDNTLALSEDLAFETCAGLTNDLLEDQGISDRYTGSQLIVDFVGQTFRGMMVSLQEKHNFELTADEYKGWVSKEEDRVVAALNAKCRECEGCSEELEKLATSKKYHLAIVSSSAYQRIFAAIRKVGHEKYFEPEHIYSASSSLPKPTFKPDPAIYFGLWKSSAKNQRSVLPSRTAGVALTVRFARASVS